MTNEGRLAAAIEELAQAREELLAAQHLLDAGLPRVAVTRAYYACFHAARGVLVHGGHEPRSQAGVLHLFSQHVVKASRASPAMGRALARLQKYREQADYDAAFVVDAEGAREEIDAARAFVSAMTTLATAGEPE